MDSVGRCCVNISIVQDSEKSAPVMKSSRVEQDPPSSPHTASTRELTSQEQASTVAPSPNTEEASAAKKPSMTKMDSIEATLICEICQVGIVTR